MKWRPRLGLVVLAILLTVLALPLAGLFFFRLAENQLVRATEAELIAQGAVVAALFAEEAERAGIPPEKLGAPMPLAPPGFGAGDYRPVEPQLDLARDPTLPLRPEAVPAPTPADPAFTALGARLAGVLAATQQATLAGFRLLDPQGAVIAGRAELGKSLAEIEEVRAALAGRYASRLRQRISNEPAPPLYSVSRGTGIRIFVAMPVAVQGRVAGVVYLSRTPSNIVKQLYGERGKLLVAGVAIAGATALMGFVFVRTIGRPMHELMERTARIAAGDAGAIAPLRHYGTREMAQLAGAFLDMAKKLRARSDTIRTFATHLSHELKSPLTAIQGAAELLRDNGLEMDEAQRKRFHENIVADADRLNRLVRRLIELARAESAEAGSESATLAQALPLLAREERLAVAVEVGENLALRMSAENLAIVLSNLIDNSAHHGARTFTLTATEEESRVAIRAADDGAGISPNNRARIFEPFFTTRRESGGTGMGLDIVAALVKAHGGRIALVEAPVEGPRGASFEIVLPAASAA